MTARRGNRQSRVADYRVSLRARLPVYARLARLLNVRIDDPVAAANSPGKNSRLQRKIERDRRLAF